MLLAVLIAPVPAVGISSPLNAAVKAVEPLSTPVQGDGFTHWCPWVFAEVRETADAWIYGAGPTQEEIQQKEQEEREKAERSWEMLYNPPILIEKSADPHNPFIDRSSH